VQESELVGKRILVDIREFDRTLKLRRNRNFSGVIIASGESGIEIRRDGTGEIESLLADEDDLEVAEHGEYWLRTTGAAIAQPDVLAEWTRYDELPGHGGIVRDG